MRKIAYGVNGVGLGHATASGRVIDDLLEREGELEILIFSSMAALDFFREAYGSHKRVKVEGVWGIDAQMRKGEVSFFRTALHLLPHLGRKRERLQELSRRLREEGISLLITDFEHYTPRAALLAGIPFLAFSHSLFVRFLKLSPRELPSGVRADYVLAKNTVKYLYPLGKINIVNTFYPFPHEEEKMEKEVAFLGPILQRKLIAVRDLVEEQDFVLVYPKAPNEDIFLEFVREIPHLDFVFYVREPQRFRETSHIRFKAFSPEGFLQDLARCNFAFSTAGHQLPCEALFLRKPMIVVPEGGQFEQYYNGHMLEKMGGGISVPLKGMHSRVLTDFADRIEVYRAKLDEVRIEDATPAALAILRTELGQLGPA
jgi:uncharacterized protein (TIGR00661 family)